MVQCELLDSERKLYDQLHASSPSRFEALLAEGKVYSVLLEILLPLRQAACHTALLLSSGRALLAGLLAIRQDG